MGQLESLMKLSNKNKNKIKKVFDERWLLFFDVLSN
jgi:hypothetical protein